MKTYQSPSACQCGENVMTIGEARTTRGEPIYPFVCLRCGEVQMQWARKVVALAHARQFGQLPQVKTKTQKNPVLFEAIAAESAAKKCEVCGEGHAHLHHWAPWHLFGGEAERWPKSHLCQDCHARWHKIVTPNMSNARNDIGGDE